MIDGETLLSRSPRGLHDYFVALDTVHEESETPIHQRWTEILTWIPAMRGRTLVDDLSDIYEDALENASGLRLFCAHDLAMLQCRFYAALFENRMMAVHVRDLHMTQAVVWQWKLSDRMAKVGQIRRQGTRIRKASFAPKQKHYSWLH